MRSLSQRSTNDLLKLETKVLSPTQCRQDSQVLMALEHWELAGKNYFDAGGEPLSKSRKKGGLLRLLPDALRGRVIWDIGGDKSAGDVIEWLRERLQTSETWQERHNHAAMVDGDGDDEDLDDEAKSELHALGEYADTQEVAAVFRRNMQRRAHRDQRAPLRRGVPAPGVPRGPSRDTGPPRRREDLKCPNCLESGHSGFECKLPKVEKRKCFRCLQTGHQARNCPENKEGQSSSPHRGDGCSGDLLHRGR